MPRPCSGARLDFEGPTRRGSARSAGSSEVRSRDRSSRRPGALRPSGSPRGRRRRARRRLEVRGRDLLWKAHVLCCNEATGDKSVVRAEPARATRSGPGIRPIPDLMPAATDGRFFAHARRLPVVQTGCLPRAVGDARVSSEAVPLDYSASRSSGRSLRHDTKTGDRSAAPPHAGTRAPDQRAHCPPRRKAGRRRLVASRPNGPRSDRADRREDTAG